MAEGARLESVYTATYRGFESLPHRHLLEKRRLRGRLFLYLEFIETNNSRLTDALSVNDAITLLKSLPSLQWPGNVLNLCSFLQLPCDHLSKRFDLLLSFQAP